MLYIWYCYYMFVTAEYVTLRGVVDPCNVRIRDEMRHYDNREARKGMKDISNYFADFQRWAKTNADFDHYIGPAKAATALTRFNNG